MTATAYYNENDPAAAAWLRELIKGNHIAPGEVDERSIEDIRPDELAGFTQCHFFAGIGVWSYALRLAGWPDDRSVWTGSCPCQPFSAAGKGAGFADERHLWPSWFHLISQRRPATIFGEQVASKDGNAWLDLVWSDLESLAYTFAPAVLPAAGFGAPHGRHRIFFVADTTRGRFRVNGGAPGITGHVDQRITAGSTLGNTTGTRRKRHVESALRRERERSGEHARIAGSGTTGIMGDTIGPGLERHGGNVGDRNKPGRIGSNTPRSTTAAGESVSLADTMRERISGGNQRGSREGGEQAQPEIRQGGANEFGDGCADDDPVDHPAGARHSCEGQGAEGETRNETRECGSELRRATNGFWRNAEWLYCRDGKYRATEPGLAPLVAGAAARVVRLRGYGNAINAEVARHFISAFIETCKEKDQEGGTVK